MGKQAAGKAKAVGKKAPPTQPPTPTPPPSATNPLNTQYLADLRVDIQLIIDYYGAVFEQLDPLPLADGNHGG